VRSFRRAALALVLLGCATSAGCDDKNSPAGGAAASGSAGAAGSAAAAAAGAGPAPVSERLGALLAAEHRRAAAEVTPADQQSRDLAVRRAAARALARIGGDAARSGLLRALSDEDGEVIAWGAYGLGFWCKGHEDASVSALVARALARGVEAAPAGGAGGAADRLDPMATIARAVGRCAAAASEPTLVAWLAGPRDRAVHAAYALGDLASVKNRLREETLVALLNLAAGSAAAPPVPEALYPIGRIEHLPLTVLERTRDVAAARLAEAGDARLFAVRALGRAGEAAAGELGRVLTTPAVFSAAERAEAARGLKRLGQAGQRALAQALPSLVPAADPVALTGLVGDDLGALLTALESLEAPGAARKALRDLAALSPPPEAPPAIARRVSWLRCAAAAALAGEDHRDPLLVGCDVTAPPEAPAPAGAEPRPAPAGSIGARAVVQVIGRGEITGARLAAWRAHAEGGERRARQAAIELIAAHVEIEGAAAVLARALSAGEPGLVGAAAEVISKHPQRASAPAPAERPRKRKKRRGDAGAGKDDEAAALAPAPAVVEALLAALERSAGGQDPELVDALVDAAGALALKQAEPRLEALCRSPYPTTRGRAEKALGLIRGKAAACPAPGAGDTPAELGALVRAPVTLAIESDAGELTLALDPALAPVAVTRFVELARAGYYNGMVVHRVVPGFVTQFGAPFGDGYGGPPGKPALRCETSPLQFEPLRVGVALAGRDTGSSQIFVMHGRAPHLDGQYALVGSATGPWAAFVDGDLIRKVTVRQ